MIEDSHIVNLDLAHLGELHQGAFGVRVDKCLDLLMKDIVDRPANGAGKPETRKLKIELELTPEVSLADGVITLAAINVEATVKGAVPTYRTARTDVRIRSGRLKFNKPNPQRFEQPPLDFPETSENND